MKFRASQLGKLMTSSRTKGEALSQTAKTYIIEQAKQDFYGYKAQLMNKYVLKGIEQEQDSIDLLNLVRLEDYKKNEHRIENEWLSGSCDIITENLIIDIKSSWSLETFPATSYELKDLSEYEWQGRAYMWLYDRPSFELVYTMYDTDDTLLTDWDNKSIHKVNHIPAHHRVTVLRYERDLAIEEQIKERLRACSEYYAQYVNGLNNK